MYSKTLLEISIIASIVRLEWSQVKSPIRMLIRSVTDYMDRKIIFILASLRRETKSGFRKSKTFTQRVTPKVSIAFCPYFIFITEFYSDWSDTIYTIINSQKSLNVCYYTLQNPDGDKLERTFYSDELNFVSRPVKS